MFKSALHQIIRVTALLGLLLQLGPLLAAAPTASAPPIVDSGTWLQAQCAGFASAPSLTVENAFCTGYVRGVIQAWFTAESQVNQSGSRFWIQEYGGIPSYEFAQTVFTYLQHHPGDLSTSAVSLIIKAINQVYPIPSGS